MLKILYAGCLGLFCHFVARVLLFDALVRGKPPDSGARNLVTEKTRNLEAAHGKDFVILAYVVLIPLTSVTDRQTVLLLRFK